MNFASLDPTLREWLFAREMMRRLGFSADDLYLIIDPPGRKFLEDGTPVVLKRPLITLQLRHQGKQFNWTVGPTDVPDSELIKTYEEMCEFWNNSSREECMKEYQKSEAYKMRHQLLHALAKKGIWVQEPN